MVHRFLALWEAVADGRPYPAITDFTADMLAPFKDNVVLIDLQNGIEAPVLAYVGPLITRKMGQSYRGSTPDEVPRRTILSRITDHMLEVIANCAPIGFEAEFSDDAGHLIPYRGILAPLSNDGSTIDFIIATINWRAEVIDLGEVEILAPVPEDVTPETPASLHVKAAARVDTTDLSEMVFALREEAVLAGRSRPALYGLLSRIHEFAGKAQQDPEAFAALMDKEGIRMQGRSRHTAILKLIRGPDYDKTRLTEYAAALALAADDGLDREGFEAALVAPGGLKAMVREQRARRRATSASPAMAASQPAPGKVATKGADRVAPLRLKAAIPDWRGARSRPGDRVLLLARHGADGLLEIFDVVEGDLDRAREWLAPEGLAGNTR